MGSVATTILFNFLNYNQSTLLSNVVAIGEAVGIEGNLSDRIYVGKVTTFLRPVNIYIFLDPTTFKGYGSPWIKDRYFLRNHATNSG